MTSDRSSFSVALSEELQTILEVEVARMRADNELEQDLLEQGWHRLPVDGEHDHVYCNRSMLIWLAQNCTHGYKVMYGRVLFEKEEDALAFKFTWL